MLTLAHPSLVEAATPGLLLQAQAMTAKMKLGAIMQANVLVTRLNIACLRSLRETHRTPRSMEAQSV